MATKRSVQERREKFRRAILGEEEPEPLFWEVGGITQVPLYSLKAAVGGGEFFSEENIERYFEASSMFLADLGARPENVIAVRVTGD